MSLELDTLLHLGRGAWPALLVDAVTLETHVGRLETRGAMPLAKYAADLYLACACAAKVRGAVEAFEALYAQPMRRAIARVHGAPEFVEEALQLLRTKLFVADPPEIANYGGRAKLGTWLTTVAARTALHLRESTRDRRQVELEDDPVAVGVDLELDYVRERYREDFRLAVAAAVERLSNKERALLRLHLGERLGLDRLAVVYGVSRATVARWLAAARGSLMEESRREVQARLGITPSELVEVGADLRSAIDVSLIRLLASRDA